MKWNDEMMGLREREKKNDSTKINLPEGKCLIFFDTNSRGDALLLHTRVK